MQELFVRSAADDFSLDLKNMRFRDQFNCFSRDIIQVALICGKEKLLHNLNFIKQNSEARQSKKL